MDLKEIKDKYVDMGFPEVVERGGGGADGCYELYENDIVELSSTLKGVEL